MNGHRRSLAWLLLALVLLAHGRGAAAQESRGAITGRVTDNTRAVVPGATVIVVHSATNATTTLTTTDAGQYTALYLTPGVYRVTVELAGFARTVHDNVTVAVGTRVQLDVELTPSNVVETVEVAAERTPLSETTATIGTVISATLITELPLGDGTAYSLTRLAAGSTFEGGYALQRPMDNGNLTGLTVGGVGRSEFSLDGSNNNVGIGMGISPPADAVQEFKVETAAYDAQVGHTGAGTVNLALKSGTNALRGSAYVFNRDDARAANDFASNSQGREKASRNYTRYGITTGGPVRRNKTFFMFSYERLQDDQVEPVFRTVPTEKMRRGDFSELLPQTVIYDPLTAQRMPDGRVVRQPFPGNIIPANRLNPITQNALGYYPLPNATPAADGSRNYFAQQPWTYSYNLQMGRVDHEFTPNQRTYARFVRNTRDEERSDWAGVQNGVQITRGVDNRNNYNLALGHTMVLAPTLFLDVKANALRFSQGQRPYEDVDPSSLGFSGQTLELMRGFASLPRFDINGVDTIGSATPAFGSERVQPYYNYSFNPTMTKIAGGHTLRAGYDLRVLRENRLDEGYKGGRYTFNGDYTRESSTSANNQFGQGMAAFVLGMPTAGFIDTTTSRSNQVVSHAVFFQDDWRVSSRLTLNLGLRYDIERGMTERYDRNVRGFDFASANPIGAAAQAAYARSPIPQIAAADFRVLGGYTYASADQRAFWDADRNNVQPRLGAAFKVNDRTLLRGGVGLFVPLFEMGTAPVNQIGFSRQTPMTITQDQGLTFVSDLNTPFPGGLLEPVGTALGLRTNLGNSPATVVPVERKNAQYWHFSLGLQRELPWNTVLEVSYVGQRGQNLAVGQPVNYLPEAYRTASPIRDTAAETFLTTPVANPFQGLLPDAPGVNGATIPRSRLLMAYPQFGEFSVEGYDGSNRYDALLVSLDKRFSNGLSVLANYTYSSLWEKVTRLNPWEGLEDRVSPRDRPHRVAFATVAQLPFGRDRRWGRDWPLLLDALAGGWQLSANYQFQTGNPLEWTANLYYDPSRDPRELATRIGETDDQGRKIGVDVPAWDLSGFYFHDPSVQTNGVDDPRKQIADQRIALGSANVRRFPTTLPDFRHQDHHSLDLGIGKTFRLGRAMRLQIRAEAINALNYTIFRDTTVDRNPRSATFGFVNDPGASIVVMRPRDIQIGARFTF